MYKVGNSSKQGIDWCTCKIVVILFLWDLTFRIFQFHINLANRKTLKGPSKWSVKHDSSKQCWTMFHGVAKWVQQCKTCFLKQTMRILGPNLPKLRCECMRESNNVLRVVQTNQTFVHQTQGQKKCFRMFDSYR